MTPAPSIQKKNTRDVPVKKVSCVIQSEAKVSFLASPYQGEAAPPARVKVHRRILLREMPYLITASQAGNHYGMDAERKITVHVRTDLLDKAQKAAKAGVSETVRKGLELLAASEAYDGLLKLRGKVKFAVDLRELRQDRR